MRLALSDDFDTPRAVRHLASLCALISPHLKELTQGDLGPVVSARNFAAETLSLLGVGASSIGAAAAGEGLGEMKVGDAGRGGLVGNDGLPPARDVVDAMVEFRRMARKHVLERNLKKNPVSGKLMKRYGYVRTEGSLICCFCTLWGRQGRVERRERAVSRYRAKVVRSRPMRVSVVPRTKQRRCSSGNQPLLGFVLWRTSAREFYFRLCPKPT